MWKQSADYPVIHLPDNASEAPEQVGSKFKFWLTDPQLGRSLFREGRPGTGENWAEKVAGELAGMLGLPHARYELAIWQGRKGIITPTFVPKDSRLVLGNELLATDIRDYDPEVRYSQKHYTVRHVAKILQGGAHNPPLCWDKEETISTTIGIFVGYIMLDAWIGNTDRHHENWGFVRMPGGNISLTPTYDHASCLGRELTDQKREERLVTRDARQSISAYIGKGRSAFYKSTSSRKPLTLAEAFSEFHGLDPDSAKVWLCQLARLNNAQIKAVFSQIPNEFITEKSAEFALAMLKETRSLLLNSYECGE